MNAELKEKWLVALRSGDFKQSRGTLCDSLYNTYCCLGVLCKINGLMERVGLANYFGDKSTTNLPDSYSYKIGISASQEKTLVEMNDKERKSFTEIADWIESNL